MVLFRFKTSADKRIEYLYETTTETEVSAATEECLKMNNQMILIHALADSIKDLAAHGPMRTPEERGLGEDSSEDDLDDVDDETRGDSASGLGPQVDEYKQRVGYAPDAPMKEVLTKACTEAKAAISKDRASQYTPIPPSEVDHALDTLKGATMIAYPGGLPEYDTTAMLLEQRGEYERGEVQEKGVFLLSTGHLWFAGKPLDRSTKLKERLGRNEKTTIVVAPSRSATQAPVRENEAGGYNRDAMEWAWRREQSLKQAEQGASDDASYLEREWADPSGLQRTLQGASKFRFR
ncbi:protein of unknown function DUF2870 [Kipferlia bialata]|uniref:Uncharacterized protein n=1 Tax=Kipferlia bialata TaxID=797122 RepID=A0A9K3D032_9EUKA|nr:protein of unknown function DUF2870 [Kipferlia bialata]GIQ84784.1 protein of unknown function DUF2870 [Kipferlia bialata]|eukprot:g3916.t1